MVWHSTKAKLTSKYIENHIKKSPLYGAETCKLHAHINNIAIQLLLFLRTPLLNKILTTLRKLSRFFAFLSQDHVTSVATPIMELVRIVAMKLYYSTKKKNKNEGYEFTCKKKYLPQAHMTNNKRYCCLLKTTNCSFPVASALQLIYNSNQHHLLHFLEYLLPSISITHRQILHLIIL